MMHAPLLYALLLTSAATPVDLGKVGTVTLPNSCSPAVQADFARGMALLHSFFYEEARTVFEDVTARDATCAMAFFGAAMTYYHPLWAPPAVADIPLGTEAAKRAQALPSKPGIEQGLIGAIHAYWMGGTATAGPAHEGSASCHGGAPSVSGRAEAFRFALATLHQRFPADVEVTSFYALSLLGTAPKEDRTLAQQKEAASLLEAMWKKHPNHPGVVHYLIHAYDYPEIARQGLPAARAYGRIAPQVPHALHMPSHIFSRLGMWPEEESANVASLSAAERWSSLRHPGTAYFDALHALDYLEYGYLQQGRYAEAEKEALRMAAVKEVYPRSEFPAAFARAILPARLVLEREQWSEAAVLEVTPISAWDDFPLVRGLVEYAHALGAARAGDPDRSRAVLVRLEEIEKSVPAGPFGYFAKLLASYRLAASAWVAHAEKRDDEALALLQKAADLEDAIGPHPVSPGPLLPARELLGDLLLELKRPRDARSAFELSLSRYPQRLRSVRGAMRAAGQDGDTRAAREFARKLVELTAQGGGEAAAEARALLR